MNAVFERALDELYREYNGDDSEYGEDTPAHEPRGLSFAKLPVAGGCILAPILLPG